MLISSGVWLAILELVQNPLTDKLAITTIRKNDHSNLLFMDLLIVSTELRFAFATFTSHRKLFDR